MSAKPYYVAAWVPTNRLDDPPELSIRLFDDPNAAWGFVESLPTKARREGVEWRVYRLARVWPLGESS